MRFTEVISDGTPKASTSSSDQGPRESTRSLSAARAALVRVPVSRFCSRYQLPFRTMRSRKYTSRTCSITRSEEHTSELQSRFDLVCRLLLEKKNYIFI